MRGIVLISIVAASAYALTAMGTHTKKNAFHQFSATQVSYSNNQRSSHILTSTSSLTASASEGTVSGGEATLASSTFNLAKSIIGAGVLSLPSGIAFFSDSKTALLPAYLMAVVFGSMAAYSFSLVGRVCKETGAKSFQEAWERTVNPKTASLISGAITALCFSASLAYSIIIADSFSSLFHTFNLPAVISKRSNALLLLTSTIIFPLVSLKNLASLAPFSLLGLGGTFYTSVFMLVRLLDGSYAAGGKFFKDVTQPLFDVRGAYKVDQRMFVLLSMLSTSYIAHYGAPAFYHEMKDNTMQRFNTMVAAAFGVAVLMFCFVMSTGFLTFGGATAGFVLNNYSGLDRLATVARCAIGVALVTGYPFVFSALRDGAMDVMGLTGEAREKKFKPLSIALVVAVTSLALVLKDVGFVVSVSGALLGCPLMLMVPTMMNIGAIKKKAIKLGRSVTKGEQTEIRANYSMIGVGAVMSLLGVGVSVSKQLGLL